MRQFEFIRPQSVEQAISVHATAHTTDQNAAMRVGEGVYLAGGTTLLDLVKLDVMRPARVIDIHRLGMDRIDRLPDGRLRIGALVTNTTLAYDPTVVRDYPVLSQALLSGASTALRNKATTAGNVMQRVRCGYFRDGVSPCNKREPGSGCAAIGGHHRSLHAVLGGSAQCIAAHPSDMCVAMAAIGATVHVQGAKGARDIAFADFHLLPGSTPWREHALADDEIITHVTLDAPLANARSGYLKRRDRASYQFALASCAVILSLDGSTVREARVALGGVATKPWRAMKAEQVLRGAVVSPASLDVWQRAAVAALDGAHDYGQNGFKIALCEQAIVRNLSRLAAGGTV
ncbi:FAD binding domain-containing protein [Pandoraea pneumonica]|uniref:FAD binding domain-containing protein n=1 Tax=Pandoraea pneumonica TaxID=2508299 RepID=UPI003CE6B53A